MLQNFHLKHHGRYHTKEAPRCAHLINNDPKQHQYIYTVTYHRKNIADQNLLSHAIISKCVWRQPNVYKAAQTWITQVVLRKHIYGWVFTQNINASINCHLSR